MTRLVKIVDNKYVQIEEYKNSNICFNTNEYSASEDCCTLRETFDPFEMFYENQGLKKQLDNYKNRYKNYLNNKLSEDVEPDFEDYYLAEVEWKANEYDKLFERNKRLRKVNKDISKGLQKILLKRNKWKKRYETEHRKTQELNRDLKGKEFKQKEFIGYLEKEIVDSRAGSSQYYSAIEHLKLYNKVIGGDK